MVGGVTTTVVVKFSDFMSRHPNIMERNCSSGDKH